MGEKLTEVEAVGTLSGDLPAPSHSLCLALEYLAWVADKDHGLRHGRTALYWDLIRIAQRHLKGPGRGDVA